MCHADLQIVLPDKVAKLIEVIEAAGYEAYAVGGCVRDSILGHIPDDWDITTSADPVHIKELFKRTVDTGIKHGTVTVMMDKEGFEVTTYRIDGEYEDGRHPREVTFTSDIAEDLKRRDFTINAMAYNNSSGLIDLFDGMGDIKRKMLRCVGDPKERFSEDALRMMRAVRFSAQLGYSIEQKTKDAILKMSDNLRIVSAERIQTELVKLLLSSNPDYLLTCYETGITKTVLPEFDLCMETEQKNPHHCYSVGEHILHSMKAISSDKVLRFTMLFHDIGKPLKKMEDENNTDHFYGHAAAGAEITKTVMRRLKFDNDTLNKVERLVYYHDYKIELSAVSVRRAIQKIGEDIFPYLFEVKRADACAQSQYRRKEKLEELHKLREIYDEIIKAEECVSLRTLALSGKDLIEAGMKPGKEMGETLNRLLELVLENPELNEKDILLQFLTKSY